MWYTKALLYKFKQKICLNRNCRSDVSLETLLWSKLIPLNKKPDVRPTGICEVISSNS